MSLYEKQISSNNLKKCEEMFDKLNEALFDNKIRGQIRYNNRRRRLNSISMDTSIIFSDELRYAIEIPERLVYKNDDSVVVWILSQMIMAYGMLNEVKVASNKNIYKNKRFKELANKYGVILSRGKYGFEPIGVTDKVKDIVKDIKFEKVPVYSENNGKKKSSTRKYTDKNGVSVRTTKDHILYCLDSCSQEVIEATKQFFRQYDIEPLYIKE